MNRVAVFVYCSMKICCAHPFFWRKCCNCRKKKITIHHSYVPTVITITAKNSMPLWTRCDAAESICSTFILIWPMAYIDEEAMIKHKCWGIGLGRTGTTSFCNALKILGYKKV